MVQTTEALAVSVRNSEICLELWRFFCIQVKHPDGIASFFGH